MTRAFFVSLVVLAIVFPLRTTIGQVDTSGHLKMCTSEKDCAAGTCCVLAPGRYAVPYCLPLLEENASCKPSISKYNGTIEFPNGNKVVVTDAHHIICPCGDGLYCDIKKKGICVQKGK